MSAVRRHNNRSTTRVALSLPYARRTKNSTWSLTSLLSFLNPLRSRGSSMDDGLSSSDESEEEVVEERQNPGVSTSTSTAAQTLFKKGQQLAEKMRTTGHDLHEQFSDTNTPSIPPGSPAKRKSPEPPITIPSTAFTFTAKPSRTKNIDTVSEYLTQHVNQPISEAEVKTLVTLLQQSKPEHFRFESRPPTLLPQSRSPSAPAPTASTTHPPRTLTRNPNGTYTWKGAGSSRTSRSRNRFSSPAFRMSPVSRPEKRTSPERPINDVKRRRTGEAPVTLQISTTTSDDTGPQNQEPFRATSPNNTRPSTTGSTHKASPRSTSPVRYRTAGLQKPTTPVHPSPLRQAWSDASPSANESAPSQKPSPVKQTETAKHVSELVNSLKTKEKISDIANPYETASPVKPKPAPKRKRVTAVAKKSTVAKKEKESSESKIKDLPAHAIIEATLPEGSKRSRPPPNLERSAPLDLDKRKEKSQPDDEDEAPPSKRAKPSLNGHPILPPPQVEEPQKVESQAPTAVPKEPIENSMPVKVPVINIVPPTSSTTTNKPLFGGPRSSTIPKEPSKLRFSMQAESTSAPPSPPSVPIPAKEETTSAFTATSNSSKAASSSNEATGGAPQFIFSSTTVKQPATFGFATAPRTEDSKSGPISTSTPAEKDAASSSTSLFVPTEKKDVSLTFTSAPKPLNKENDAVPIGASPVPAVLSEKEETTPVFTFAPSSTEKKVPASSSNISSTTMNIDAAPIVNTDRSAKDAARDMPRSALPVFSFTYTATTSDFTKHSSARDEAKALSPSSLPTFNLHAPPHDNTASPAPAPAPAPVTSFNWGAAGVQKPFTSSGTGGEWTCGTCMLKNPASATEKCTVCDEPKPGAATSTSTIPKPSLNSSSSSASEAGSIPKSNGAVGFNWGAAGLKSSTPANDAEWTCSTCMLKNPGSATEKCTVCDAPKPGALPSAPKAAFNWAAADIQPAPSAAGAEWTCGTCMLKNPGSATEKCTVCDAERS